MPFRRTPSLSKIKKFKFVWFLLFITVISYCNSVYNGFVWDEHYIIVENKFIKSFRYIGNFFSKDYWKNSAIDFSSGFYRPLILVSFLLDYKIWGLNPFGFHLTNLILHSLNIIMVFVIANYICKSKFMPFLTALFFAIHPIQTEAVDSIANRGDLLAALFVLLSLYFFIKFSSLKVHNKWIFYYFSILAFVFGVFSKENAIIAPILLLAFDYYFNPKHKIIYYIRKFFGYFIALGVYILIRISVLGMGNSLAIWGLNRYVSIYAAPNLYSKMFTIAKIIFMYIKLLILPINLSADYAIRPVIRIFDIEILASLIFIASVVTLLFLLFNKQRELSFSLVWFFICIFPVSNILPIANSFAERFLYLPSIGFCFLLANILYLISRVPNRFLSFKKLSISLSILLSFFYIQATLVRNYDWRTDLSLCKKTIISCPQCPRAHYNLGIAYYQIGSFKEAAKEFKKSLEIQPKLKEAADILRDIEKTVK